MEMWFDEFIVYLEGKIGDDVMFSVFWCVCRVCVVELDVVVVVDCLW